MHDVLIVHGQRVFREGLRALLADRHDTRIVGVSSVGLKGIYLAKTLRPAIVFLDNELPDVNSADAIRAITEAVPGVRVVVFGRADGAAAVNRVIDAGALGYLTADVDAVELSAAIDEVLAGRIYLAHKLDQSVDAREQEVGAGVALTERQREVLKLMAEGNSTRRIAEILDVSVKTVETHRKHIMDRLNIRTVAELTKYAVREGISSL